MADSVLVVDKLEWSPRQGAFRLGPMNTRLEKGQFVALVGPNGAGKSSLLHIVAAMEKPVSGSVRVKDRSVSDLSPRERGRRVSLLSQDPEIPYGFSVRDYVSLGRYPYTGALGPMDKRDLRTVERELRRWALEALADRSVRRLSGGEFQRVRLARSFVQEPAILLLDEPANHLDLAVRALILSRLREEAERGATILAVLHDVNDAISYTHRVILINKGKIVAEGEPGEVLTAPLLSEIYRIPLRAIDDGRGRSLVAPDQ